MRLIFNFQFSIFNFVFATACMLMSPGSASAWGEQGHYLSNEAAALSLPNDMPEFFYRSFPELIWLGYDPDRWRGAGPSFDAVGAPDHFLDYEYVQGLELPPDRYEFLALLERSGRLRQKGITNAESGFAPWRITELTELLTSHFRRWRSSIPGSPERAFLERDIIHTAGILGHYVADVANPLHTTMHYNGWVMPNPKGYANDCEIHSRFETVFVSHAITLDDITRRMREPQLRADPWTAALAHLHASFALVEPLYALDKRGAFAIFGPSQREGVDFAAGRLAAGASMLRDLWWSAWKNSATRRSR